MREFERDGSWNILGLAFSRAGEKLRKVNITDKEAVISVMQDFKVWILSSDSNIYVCLPVCVLAPP